MGFPGGSGVLDRAASDIGTGLGAKQAPFTILTASDEETFDVQRLLLTEARLADKVERLSAARVP